MIRTRICGIIAGALVGALPFWLLALVRTGERWPGWVVLAVGLVASATAFRAPAAWALGVVAGVAASWAALWILVGTDWRLLPYVVAVSYLYYFGATAVLVTAYFLGSLRVSRRG
jgi:hypothetical protein